MTIAINGSVLCSFVGKYLHMGIEMKFYRAEIKIKYKKISIFILPALSVYWTEDSFCIINVKSQFVC